jgi:hypothetical protein
MFFYYFPEESNKTQSTFRGGLKFFYSLIMVPPGRLFFSVSYGNREKDIRSILLILSNCILEIESIH